MKTNCKLCITLIFASMCLGHCATKAVGQIILDQSNVVPASHTLEFVVGETFWPAQTFRVGTTGELARVELGVYRHGSSSGALFADIVKTQAGVPDFTLAGRLATKSISGVPNYPGIGDPSLVDFNIVVDFSSSHLQVNTGDVLAIALRSSANEFFGCSWRTGNQFFNPYLDGSPSSYRPQLSYIIPHSETDAHFRTFVLVPEPSCAFLLATGLAAAATRRVRRN